MTPRHPSQRRARQMMLWFALALALSPIPGGMLVDHCPLRIRFPDAAAVLADWRGSQPRPNIVMFGSSKTYTLTQADLLASEAQRLTGDSSIRVLSAAVGAGEPLAIRYLAAKLFAGESTPPLVIVEAAPDFVSCGSTFWGFVIHRQMVAADLPRYLADMYSYSQLSLRRTASSRLTPFFFHRSILLNWAASLVDITIPKAAVTAVAEVNELPERSADFAKKKPAISIQPGDRTNEAIPKNAGLLRALAKVMRINKLAGIRSEALESVVSMLHDGGSTVALVQFPSSVQYRKRFTPEIKAQYDAYIGHLQKSYGCIFGNFSDRLPDAYFDDVYHGNAEGSREFTKILAREIVAPAWNRLKQNKNPGVRVNAGAL